MGARIRKVRSISFHSLLVPFNSFIFPSSLSERTPLKSALKRSPSQRSVRKEKEPASKDEGEDPRFEIYIMGPEDQGAQFKTRGRHPVRKVLQAACKAFELDYDR